MFYCSIGCLLCGCWAGYDASIQEMRPTQSTIAFQCTLPEYGHAQVLPVPQDERDPLVVVGEADVAREVDAGAGQARDLRRVAA